jgi:hypothetical protein
MTNVGQQQNKERRKISLRGWASSPYVLMLAPVLIAGFYLVLHPEYIGWALNNPYSVACILAIPVCIFLVKLVFNFFSVIEQWIRLQFERIKGAKRGQFLEFVIAVFMFVSVCEAGPFFNKVQGAILYGALGYITVFAFDLVAVVCMKSRAKMLRKGHDKQALVYQMGVWLCALVSIYANADSAIQNLSSIIVDKNPIAFLAPLAGVAFPVMIIFLSYATDADEDIDDPAIFKQEQQKRVDFAKAKREIATALFEEKVQFSLLYQREFFLKSWLFTKGKVTFVIETITAQIKVSIAEEIKQLKEELSRKEQTIQGHIKHIEMLYEDMQKQSQMMSLQMTTFEHLQIEYADLKQEVFQCTVFMQDVSQNLLESEATFEHEVSTDEMEAVVSETPAPVRGKITQELPRLEAVTKQKSSAPVSIKSRSKLAKNRYSKAEAAQIAKCRLSEIEDAIANGQLSLAVNSDKVLKTSLRNFIAERRKSTRDVVSVG